VGSPEPLRGCCFVRCANPNCGPCSTVARGFSPAEIGGDHPARFAEPASVAARPNRDPSTITRRRKAIQRSVAASWKPQAEAFR